VARLPDDRRAATLVAFIRTLEASASDDVIDLFDVVSTRMFSNARINARDARMRSLRDLDAASLRLRDAGVVLLDDSISDAQVRAAVFALVDRAALTDAVAQVNLLARPNDESYFVELRQQAGTMRYLPKMLAPPDLAAAPAGQPLLDAVDHLRRVHRGEKRRGPPPTSFVPKGWARQLKSDDGTFDLTGYRLCTLDRLRRAIRRRDVFPVRSLRYADPRKGLLTGAAWEAARPTVCRTVGVAVAGDEEIARLSARLDLAYRETAARVPDNDAVTITKTASGADLSIAPLDRIDEPLSLTDLHRAIDARLPQLDLPELILEMHARTGFAAAFTHASEGNARAEDIATTICAVLVAEATNTGFEPLVRPEVSALRRSRLSWVKQNFIRAETLTTANALLVAAHNRIPLARVWGSGEVASADGLRFTVPVRTIHAGPNPRYFGRERGITWYNLVSDRFSGLNALTVPGTLRDSLYLLAVVLDQETRVFLGQLVQGGGKFLFLPAGAGFDRQAEHGLREIQRPEPDVVLVVAVVQHGVEVDVLDLGHGGDVAGHGLVDFHVVLALQLEKMPDLERLAAVADEELRVAPDGALEHAEHRSLADERVDDDFEHVRDHVLLRIRRGADFNGGGDLAFIEGRRVAFGRVRHQPREHVEEFRHARAVACRYEAHRHEVTVAQRLLDFQRLSLFSVK